MTWSGWHSSSTLPAPLATKSSPRRKLCARLRRGTTCWSSLWPPACWTIASRPPDYVEPDASQYVQKVLNHTLTEFYPGDDYTQYEPRGHYDGDEQLERYFRAVKWLSRRIFRIEDYFYPADADLELTAAALLAQPCGRRPGH